MAQSTLTLSSPNLDHMHPTTKVRSYWGAVWRQIYHDKITLFALCLLIFVVSLSLGATWLSAHVLGFNPTATDLRARNKPPTWASEAWPQFQDFSNSCAEQSGC